MNSKTYLKDWIPVISKLIYPIFVVVVCLVFWNEISNFYNKKIMTENADVKGGIFGLEFEIKQKANQITIKELDFSNLALKAISDAEYQPTSENDANNYVTKSTSNELRELIKSNKEKASFETLVLLSGKSFSIELLRSYINQLGISYVVFIQNGKYVGLVEAKLFINQFSEFSAIYSFSELLSEVVGMNKTMLNDDSTILEVLETMNEEDMAEIGIVDQQKKLLYIVERETIIAKLVASIITNSES